MKNKCICGHTKNLHEQGIGVCHDGRNDTSEYWCECVFFVEEIKCVKTEEWEKENPVSKVRKSLEFYMNRK